MTSRELLICSINHESPDQLCVDMSTGGQTGIGAIALHHLNQALLPGYKDKVKIIVSKQLVVKLKTTP